MLSDTLIQYRETLSVSIERIPFSESKEWSFASDQSKLSHKSGRFYSIEGYRGIDPQGRTFEQPLINQPETGIMGFIIRNHGTDNPEFLIQARTEPGNVGIVQAGPTIQATESNFKRVHGGKEPAYLSDFMSPAPEDLILRQRQAELGSRFFRKWNYNVIVQRPEAEIAAERFFWRSLEEFCSGLLQDNVVNNDARLVLGLYMLEFEDVWLRRAKGPLTEQDASTADEIAPVFEFLKRLRERTALEVESIPLNALANWEIRDSGIFRRHGGGFSVEQFRVSANDREVVSWDQPLVVSPEIGLSGLICQESSRGIKVLFHGVAELGLHQGAELEPSVTETDGSEIAQELRKIVEAHPSLFDCIGSEEGGRFYQNQKRFRGVLIPAGEQVPVGDDYIWLTLPQIRTLMNHENVFADETRGALAYLLASAYVGG